MQPSPAPRRRIPRWPFALAALLLAVAGGIAVVLWWLPGYVRTRVHDTAVAKLESLLGREVTVEDVHVEVGRARLAGIVVGDPDAPIIVLDEVRIAYDADALWDRKVVVQAVEVEGGRVVGTRAQLEAITDRIRNRERKDPDAPKGRIQLVPDSLVATGIEIDVTDATGEGRGHVAGRVDATVWPRERDVQVSLSHALLDDENGHVVHAGRIATTLHLESEPTRPAFPLVVELENMGTQITEQIAVAGTSGTVRLADARLSRVDVDLEGGFSDRGDEGADRLWSIDGWFLRDKDEGRARVMMDDFELGRIPQVLERLPLVDSEYATVGGRLAVDVRAGMVRAEGELAVEGLNVDHRTLARQVVRGVGFELALAAEIEPGTHHVRVPFARLRRDGVEVKLDADILHKERERERLYDVHMQMPKVSCQQVLDALPPQLIPALEGFELGGEIDAEVVAHVPYEDLDALSLDGSFDIWGCDVLARPEHAAAERLAASFVHTVTMRDGQTRTVRLEPGSGTYAPLHSISPYMLAAVLSTEDGGFYRHRGFLPSQFETALRRNLAAGEVRLGASTITMQMVKNVLLSHERTLSRKLQEMFLTWYVETVLTKDRMMEIYLNIVELGPGVYGVKRAANHYFGKHPADLDPAEATYLALMLPSPVRRHAQYCRGELTDGFKTKIARILGIMHARGRIDELDYELYRGGDVIFDLSERGGTSSCYEEIDRLMNSMYGQRAVTGLLSGAPRSRSADPRAATVADRGDAGRATVGTGGDAG